VAEYETPSIYAWKGVHCGIACGAVYRASNQLVLAFRTFKGWNGISSDILLVSKTRKVSELLCCTTRRRYFM